MGHQVFTMRKLSALLASTSITTSCAFLNAYLVSQSRCSALANQNRDVSSSSSSAERVTLENIAESLMEGSNYKKVLVVAGAGVSCSAGIPDVSFGFVKFDAPLCLVFVILSNSAKISH